MDHLAEKQNAIDRIPTTTEEKHTWIVVGFQEEKENFGDAFACFDNTFLRLRFIRERGNEFLDIGPSLALNEIDESLLFPFEMVSAVVQGRNAVDGYVSRFSERWLAMSHEYEAAYRNKDTTVELKFLDSHWHAFRTLFQDPSLSKLFDVRKRTEDLASKIIHEQSLEGYSRDSDHILARMLNSLQHEERRKLIDVFPDGTDKEQVEAILRDTLDGNKTQGRGPMD